MNAPVTPKDPKTKVVSTGFFKNLFSTLKKRLHNTPKIPNIISPVINAIIKGKPAPPKGFIEP